MPAAEVQRAGAQLVQPQAPERGQEVEARGVLSTQLSTGSLRGGIMYRLPGKR